MPPRNTIGQEKHSYKSRSLPHRFDTDKPIFITYRLKFTLPRSLLKTLKDRKARWFSELKKLDQREQDLRIQELDRTYYRWYDELIASHADLPDTLKRKEILDIIIEALRFHDGLRYTLLAYTISLA